MDRMHRFFLLLPLALAACSPALNWRDVRFEGAPVAAMLPCKPDRTVRDVPLGGPPVPLHVMGCEAAGATFAVMTARLDNAGAANAALAGWKTVTLTNMQASAASVREVAFQPPGSLPMPQSVRVAATGQRADGSRVAAQAVWLAQASDRGVQLVHAVVYAAGEAAVPETMAEPLFTGLRLAGQP